MKIRWCWRCQEEVPMLEKAEWKLVAEARKRGMAFVEAEMKKRGIKHFEPLPLDSYREKFRAFLTMFNLLTGERATNPNYPYHHYADLYGPDCPSCGKPLRTHEARYCAACGLGKEDFTSQDTKPLVERRPEFFK